MKPLPFLMGSETEYAVSGHDDDGDVTPDKVHGLLLEQVQYGHDWVADGGGRDGVYLGNGSRLYLDYDDHPEYATPECFTPAQVACFDRAGDRLLREAQERLRGQRPGLSTTVLKTNLDPVSPDEVTWGTHESYTCWVPAEQAAKVLIPHLVTRVLYAGAGCLSAHPQAPGFELSQRARHLVRAVGGETTRDRAIFCTRTRYARDSSGQGWTRLHLISRDSQRAPFGTYLAFGTTGPIVLLLNARREVGRGLALADPVPALRAVSCDPWQKGVRLRLADGRQLTALEVQELYLADCERATQKGELPDWASAVIRHWKETLAALAKDPLLLADRLDAYCKLRVYQQALGRAGYTWEDLRQALGILTVLRGLYPAAVVRALLAGSPEALTGDERVQYREAEAGTGASRTAERERLRLAARMLALDVCYHELGGLYDRLAEAGQVRNVVLEEAEVEQATRQPPPGGRAAVRAAHIRSCCGWGWIGDWGYLHHPATEELVDFRDPFAPAEKHDGLSRLARDNASDAGLRQLAHRLHWR
jgi:hypothetical protein